MCNCIDNRLDSLVTTWGDTINPYYAHKYKLENVLPARWVGLPYPALVVGICIGSIGPFV